jgi:hypothetical protein
LGADLPCTGDLLSAMLSCSSSAVDAATGIAAAAEVAKKLKNEAPLSERKAAAWRVDRKFGLNKRWSSVMAVAGSPILGVASYSLAAIDFYNTYNEDTADGRPGWEAAIHSGGKVAGSIVGADLVATVLGGALIEAGPVGVAVGGAVGGVVGGAGGGYLGGLAGDDLVAAIHGVGSAARWLASGSPYDDGNSTVIGPETTAI